VRYINCGDWVESCCAAVEHPDGQFEIISWVRDARRAAPEAGLAGARAA
jgi:hypothetical protein